MAGELIEIEQARRLVLAAARQLPAERVELQSAQGRVLDEQVVASEPVPAFDGSAMDGFAVQAADVTRASGAAPVALRVVGESRAGSPRSRPIRSGEAVSISTGAVVPGGADAVVPVEEAHRDGDRVEVRSAAAPGQHIRRAGEDVQAGQIVLEKGHALGPAELGVLGSLGRSDVLCARRPRVAVLVTGDELLAPDEPKRPGGVRDASSYSIPALARCAGADVGRASIVRDSAAETRAAISACLTDVDVAVICGGVSVGDHDHVRPALGELGAEEVFWGIALKPGRPAWFGTTASSLVFGLPGNPVSAMVTFVLLVAPALRALQGAPGLRRRLLAVLDEDYVKPPGRAHAVRCRLSAREDGWHAAPTGAQGSHILTSMLAADGLAIIPSQASGLRAGERVEIEPLWTWTAGGR